MSDSHDQADFIELERYELYEAPEYHFQFDRREFLRKFGAGIVLIVPISRALAQQGEGGRGESGRGGSNARVPQDIDGWIHIDEDGGVNVLTGKAEMGQNIRTSLAQAVAEELRIPVSMIRLTMADTDLTPFDMGTFGSRTTPTMAPQLRRAAAATRQVLIDLAAQQLNVEPGSVQIVNARFSNHDKSKSLSFADVAKGKKLVKVIPEDIATTPAKDWTIAGTSVPKVDGRDFVTGKHKYTSDVKLPGMLYGKVVRPSAFNATLVLADTKAAEAMPGVTVVRDGNFLGLTAPSQQAVATALKAISFDWKAPGQPSNAELFDLLRKPAPQIRGLGGEEGGLASRSPG